MIRWPSTVISPSLTLSIGPITSLTTLMLWVISEPFACGSASTRARCPILSAFADAGSPSIRTGTFGA